MCQVLKVSKSGFFDWQGRDNSERTRKINALLSKIEKIHQGSRKTYGSPRIYQTLKALGESCSKSTVERLMREHNIRAKTYRQFKTTTNSNHSLAIAPNLVKQNFAAKTPNVLWCTDITYVWTLQGWLYLAVVLDAFSRKIVGWSLKNRLTEDLATDALNMALLQKKEGAKLVHHSDRGIQYAAQGYQKILNENQITRSMSRKGHCWDNAMVESFFHTLKTEHVYHERFRTHQEAKSSIFEWIEVFYNRQRIHSAIGFKTPQWYESHAA